MGDDAATIRTFGEEVAPLVRDLVATERATRGSGVAGAGR